MERHEVVIVGGGIGGGALAVVLARAGTDVVVLEASTEYQDRVRGESMMPWGRLEARKLGVEQILLDAGAHSTAVWLHYDPNVPLEVTQANPIPAGMIIEGVEGSLNLRHPDACQALADVAAAAGASVRRGASEVKVTPGPDPLVTYADETGAIIDITARLVVGADGRSSTVRRQVGIELERQPETNMVAGLLLDGLDRVPADHDFLAAEGELFMASFHQGGGRIRIYLCPGVQHRHRFAGSGGLEEFMRSVPFSCLPFGDELAKGTPAGPLATYPGDDTWTATPFVEGVVLIGDAAGHNNPVIGQGLSLAMRDVRMVSEIVAAGNLAPAAFVPYGEERTERMRRLRFTATFLAAAMADDADDRLRRRARFFELQATEPQMMALLGANFGGPELGPPEAFDGSLMAALLDA